MGQSSDSTHSKTRILCILRGGANFDRQETNTLSIEDFDVFRWLLMLRPNRSDRTGHQLIEWLNLKLDRVPRLVVSSHLLRQKHLNLQ